MSTKSVIPWAILLALLGTRSLRAQPDYLRSRESPDVPSATQAPLLPEMPPPIALPPVTGPDNYITYRQPCCCGPVGGDGPITWELFIRTGPLLPVAGSFLNHFVDTGWMVWGGGRTLFYDVDRTAAWTAELGLMASFNQGRNNMWVQRGPERIIPVTGPPPIIIRGNRQIVDLYQQTLVNVGLGGEWYLIGAAYEPGKRWRVGADGGGLWGTANMTFHDFTPTPVELGGPNINFGQFDRKSHVAGGCYAGLHTDLECPCNCCTFLFGFRTDWQFTTTRILNGRDNGIQWVNFLLDFGVRF